MNLLSYLHLPRLRAWLTALALASVGVAHAVPYASGVKLESGILTFTLNENADGVKVIAGATTHDLGALGKGTTVTNLGITGAFRIEVRKSAPGGWAQISDDTSIVSRYNSPRGIAVNRNPASPYFGRIYIANSAAGTAAAAGTAPSRAVGDGIYVLAADLSDVLGQGNTAKTGGANFATGTSATPYRIAIGEDDNLYICDWSDSTGNLIVVDPNVTDGSAQFVLKPLASATAPGNAAVPVGLDNTHGSIAAAVIRGSLAQGNLTLFLVDEDLQTDKESTGLIEMNSLWRFDVGAGPLPSTVENSGKLSTPAVAFVSQTMDLAAGPNGYLYVTLRRSAGAQTCLQVVDPNDPDPDTRVKFNSLEASGILGSATDFLFEAGAASVSSDGKWLAVYRYGNNQVVVVPLIDGIPDLANRVVFAAFGTTAAGRAIDFDAAGNLHIASSGYAMYRVFSPGGTTTAITTSDGHFEVQAPLSSVTVTASVPDTAEGSTTPGEFTLTRAGSTTANLPVAVTLTGLASNGTDFTTVNATVTIPAGQNSVTVPIAALDDSVSEAAETVVLTIQASQTYTAGNPGVATVTIADNDSPLLSVSTVHPNAYERVTDDYILFRVTRLGNVANEVIADVTLGGPGASGATGPGNVTIPAGASTATFQVHPVDNSNLDGDRDVTATLVGGAGYSIGNATASGKIIDDELPSEAGKILFADNFETDTSTSWTARAGMGNGVDDQLVGFAYDYVNGDAIPAAPGGSNLGLKVTVNKFDGTALGAAGMNLYPNGQSFSGDYALRFNMYIQMNGGAGTTEHALAGINHAGTKANWVRQSAGTVANMPFDQDGIWAAIVADGSYVNALGHVLYTGDGAANPARALANVDPLDLEAAFKCPPYLGTTGLVGAPANTVDSATKNWVDVEIKQVGTTVTVSVNKTAIFTYQNTTAYTSGNIMLGYSDQFDSVGDSGAVYFDNVRVVRLEAPVPPTQPQISSLSVAGTTVTINFTGGTADGPTAFELQGAATVNGTFAPEAAATVIQVSPGSFSATVPTNGNIRFYRIRR